jgi:hypothetical protein
MAFNNPLKKVAQKYPKVDVVSHDWWLYMLNELVEGKTLYDQESTIFYRQHARSLVGANMGLMAKFRRLRMLLNGSYRVYNTKHLKVFKKLLHQDLKANIDVVDQFFILRDKSLKERLSIVSELGIYRQTFDTHLGLWFGLIIKKI